MNTLLETYIDFGGKVTKLGDIISEKDTWQTSDGQKILTLVGTKKLARFFNIVEMDSRQDVCPSIYNYQQHVVSVWVGSDPDKFKWTRGVGEASCLNTGIIKKGVNGEIVFDEITKIDSKYKCMMATKRAYCRAVLDHVGLFDFYSEVHDASFSGVASLAMDEQYKHEFKSL